MTPEPPPADDVPLLIAVGDVARLLSVSKLTIWRMRSAGRIPAPIKLGHLARWRRCEILAWIDAGCPTCRPAPRR